MLIHVIGFSEWHEVRNFRKPQPSLEFHIFLKLQIIWIYKIRLLLLSIQTVWQPIILLILFLKLTIENVIVILWYIPISLIPFDELIYNHILFMVMVIMVKWYHPGRTISKPTPWVALVPELSSALVLLWFSYYPRAA